MKPILALFGLLIAPFLLSAQYERKLEQSIRIYNKVKLQFEVDGVQYRQVEQSLEVCDLLLNEVLRYGAEPEGKAARYFQVLKNLLKGEMQFHPDFPNRLLGEQQLIDLAPAFIAFDEAFFPVRYFYEDEYFIVDYEDFVGTRFRFFAELTELHYRKGEFNQGRKFARLALQLGTAVDPHLAFLLMTYLLDMDPTAVETYEYARMLLQHYLSLDAAQQATLNEDDGFGLRALSSAFHQLAKDSVTIDYLDSTGLASAEMAAQLLPIAGFDSLATLFYAHAVQKGQTFEYKHTWDVLKLLDHYKKYPAAKLLCYQLAAKAAPPACYDLQRLASYFKKYGDPDLAATFEKKAKKCLKKQRKSAR